MARPREWTPARIEELRKELVEWFMEPGKESERLFYKQFLVEHKGLYHELISRLSSIDDTFRHTVKRLDEIQEQRIARLASQNKINPVFTMFVLKNKHGWVDKQEIKTENRNVNVDLASQVKDMTDEQLRESIRDLVSD